MNKAKRGRPVNPPAPPVGPTDRNWIPTSLALELVMYDRELQSKAAEELLMVSLVQGQVRAAGQCLYTKDLKGVAIPGARNDSSPLDIVETSLWSIDEWGELEYLCDFRKGSFQFAADDDGARILIDRVVLFSPDVNGLISHLGLELARRGAGGRPVKAAQWQETMIGLGLAILREAKLETTTLSKSKIVDEVLSESDSKSDQSILESVVSTVFDRRKSEIDDPASS